MEIYVYVGDELVLGDDADIDFILPFKEHGYIQETDNAIADRKKLSVFVLCTMSDGRFPKEIQDDLQIIYNVFSCGDNIYLIEKGSYKNITALFRDV